ncbi:phosphatidylinositol glycan class X [Klebsormidium nitens]|uniref:Phosphatidylinositol glycan class X n=1 Tax=Klebsormidium nitens TaxID=105231 RepID=A0A1Y1I1J6_KLENI|nr:phosphatidylinositol glycan class X [Klebsormidium nitens]|eukprot:GAQ84343.1 phosphatidylinositol glycan class X [Klebsormidium nitens]
MQAASACAVAPYRSLLQKAFLCLVALAWAFEGASGCAVSRLLGSGQASGFHTLGSIFEWRSRGGALQLGNPGSGSSGWRLADPSPLCPLLSTALSAKPPECVDSTKSRETRQYTEKTQCEAAKSNESCAWESDGPGGQFLAADWPPLKSVIVLPAPLDPVLQTALSARVNLRCPDGSIGEPSNEERKPSHIGLYFHRTPDLAETSYEGSADEGISGAVSGEWTVGGMSRELQGSGAHRQLLTRLVLSPRRSSSGGQSVRFVALVEALPTGVYADKFEVRRLASDGAASVASIFGPVDIERPAPECTQSLAIAYARPVELPGGGFEATFVLPLHSRYPAVAPIQYNGAGSQSSPQFTAVDIGPPLYVLWTEGQGLSTEEDLRMHTEWRRATWQGITDRDTVVQWRVPNGKAEHADIVRVGTVLVCLAGTVYLLSVVMLKKREPRIVG